MARPCRPAPSPPRSAAPTPPREQFVEAFVRACGLGDNEVRLWVAARKRLAREPAAEGPRANHIPTVVLVLAIVGALALLGGAGIGLDYALRTAPAPDLAVSGLALVPVGSWAEIHPSRTLSHCVTEGHDRSGRYGTEIAVQTASAA